MMCTERIQRLKVQRSASTRKTSKEHFRRDFHLTSPLPLLELERYACEMFQKPAALYFATGTQGNMCAILGELLVSKEFSKLFKGLLIC